MSKITHGQFQHLAPVENFSNFTLYSLFFFLQFNIYLFKQTCKLAPKIVFLKYKYALELVTLTN